MKKSKTISRNIHWLIGVTIITAIFVFLLIKSNVIDESKIIKLGNDFLFNLLNYASVLAGFLFTGIGILISAIGNERINRLWNHHYLDNLYHCAIFGILSNLMVIALVLINVGCNIRNNIRIITIDFMITCIVMGLVYFTWCTVKLFFLISKLKD